VNICSDAAECGKGMSGCELENGRPISPVGVEKTLQYTTDGMLKLTYKGNKKAILVRYLMFNSPQKTATNNKI